MLIIIGSWMMLFALSGFNAIKIQSLVMDGQGLFIIGNIWFCTGLIVCEIKKSRKLTSDKS